MCGEYFGLFQQHREATLIFSLSEVNLFFPPTYGYNRISSNLLDKDPVNLILEALISSPDRVGGNKGMSC